MVASALRGKSPGILFPGFQKMWCSLPADTPGPRCSTGELRRRISQRPAISNDVRDADMCSSSYRPSWAEESHPELEQ